MHTGRIRETNRDLTILLLATHVSAYFSCPDHTTSQAQPVELSRYSIWRQAVGVIAHEDKWMARAARRFLRGGLQAA